MPSREFQATEGLLNKVMRKQNAVIEKAWLEALMNSVDAGATRFVLSVTPKTTVISDDGDSMTQDEIQEYFEKFGYEDDDVEDKEYGKFRMGRGQIFNFGLNVWRARDNYMVVSLDDEKVITTLDECTAEDDGSVISHSGNEYTINTSGLSYALLDAEHQESGLDIRVEHYENITDLSDTIMEFQKLAKYVSFVHNVEVVLECEELEGGSTVINPEPEIVEETDEAWFVSCNSTFANRAPVFNKGAYVADFDLGPRRFEVISKLDLDVTLDRTDILENDQYWEEIKNQYTELCEETLVDADSVSASEANWLVERASENPSLAEEISDMPLLQDVDGEYRSIEGISETNVSFSSKGDEVASKAMDRGEAAVLRSSHEDAVKQFASASSTSVDRQSVKSYSGIVEEELTFEMSERDESKLSKRRLQNLSRIRAAVSDMGVSDTIKPGYSTQRNVWKDDEGVVFIDEDYLNQPKQAIATEALLLVLKNVSHTDDTRPGLSASHSEYREFYNIANGEVFGADADLAEVQRKLLGNGYDN